MNIKVPKELYEALDVTNTSNLIKTAIKVNTTELQREIQRGAPVLTGNLKRSFILDFIDGGFTGRVTSNVVYGPHLEYGTFKQPAQPFIRPAMRLSEDKLKSDLDKMLKK